MSNSLDFAKYSSLAKILKIKCDFRKREEKFVSSVGIRDTNYP